MTEIPVAEIFAKIDYILLKAVRDGITRESVEAGLKRAEELWRAYLPNEPFSRAEALEGLPGLEPYK